MNLGKVIKFVVGGIPMERELVSGTVDNFDEQYSVNCSIGQFLNKADEGDVTIIKTFAEHIKVEILAITNNGWEQEQGNIDALPDVRE